MDRASGVDPSGAVGVSSDGGGCTPGSASSPAEVALPPDQKMHQMRPHTTFEAPETDGEENFGGIPLLQQTMQRRDVEILSMSRWCARGGMDPARAPGMDLRRTGAR